MAVFVCLSHYHPQRAGVVRIPGQWGFLFYTGDGVGRPVKRIDWGYLLAHYSSYVAFDGSLTRKSGMVVFPRGRLETEFRPARTTSLQ